MPLRIAISGPTGCGKTTLAAALAQTADVGLVTEPQPVDLLESFSKQPSTYCEALEAEIIRGRAANARRHLGCRVQIFDRTVREDLEIFVALHHQRGFLDEAQVARLAAIGAEAEAEIGLPQAHVLMTAERHVLLLRLALARPPQPVLDSLDAQLTLYQQWAAGVTSARIVVDTTRRIPEDAPVIAAWILETAAAAVAGEAGQNETLGLAWLAGRNG